MPPKRNEDPKVKKPESLRVPGNNCEAEFTIPTKVMEDMEASLNIVGGAVYDGVENIRREDSLLGVVVLGSYCGWWAGGKLG
jgi:hypothetical protein